MTLLRTLRIVAALGALPLAGCGGDAFSLAMDAGANGSGASSGSAKSGSASGDSSGDSSGARSGASSGAASGASSGSMSGTSSGESSSGGSGSSSGAPDAGGGVVCPATAPNPGNMCPRVGFVCEYGTSPNRACNQFAHCAAAGWDYPIHSTCPTGTCPGTYDAIQAGSPCSPDGFTCGYVRGTCICATPSGPVVRLDGGTLGPTWQCRLATPSCHSPRPNVGAPCLEEGRTCDYGNCLPPDGILLQCTSGNWQEGHMPCPL